MPTAAMPDVWRFIQKGLLVRKFCSRGKVTDSISLRAGRLPNRQRYAFPLFVCPSAAHPSCSRLADHNYKLQPAQDAVVI